ncbi:MAG: hypothetical protein ABIO44_13570, partial [Saprospiraceae bacterium]
LSQESGLLFIYPQFKKESIVKIASMKDKLPAGISRHSIPNRVLHLKYPIKNLKSGDNLIQRNKELNKFIEDRIASKKVRLYREPTLIFSE